ncbi:MAG: zinc ribbon domain-containing protein [Spirochaetales bacterium]|nr:zinc ribbon domain-containing protein [Spirochaetales bacterium]
MPTYEYKCDHCGYQFERHQGMADDPIRLCPVCNGSVKRLVSGGAGIIFKGNDFHSTDYKTQNLSKNRTRCGKNEPCCGRKTPCEKPSCEE